MIELTPKDLLEKIEKSLGITLREKQIQYLTGSRNIDWERNEGRTVAHCIRTALIIDKDDEHVVLNMNRPQEFSDRYFDIGYSKMYYRDLFFKIWKKLKAGGLPVVKLKHHEKLL